MTKEEFKKMLMENLTIECERGWRQGDHSIVIYFGEDEICRCNVTRD